MLSADHKVMRLWSSLSRKKRLGAMVVLGIGIVGIALAVAFGSAGRGGGDDEIIEAVKDIVREGAFDPDAMKFRNMAVIHLKYSRTSVCGEMNGKNRMGGYTGFRPFVYNGPQADTLTMLKPDDTWCSSN